jgi:hypothetical protein
MKPIDLTGMIFGRLHVVKRAENHGGRTAWVCTCECGEQAIVMTKLLQNGRKQTRAEWAREFDINYETLSWRLANGWPVSKALTVHPGAHQ